MAPGAGGTGGPGGSRPTGTVPKTKMYDPARDQRREHGPPLNHVSNNLLGLDWQTAHTYDRRTRKNSNRSFSDHYELPLPAPMDEGGSSHDNRCITSTYTPPDSSQWSSPGRTPPDMDVLSPARDQAQRNVMRDKSNISKTTERSEVVSRLNQIYDYIKQTSYLMDTLKNSENSNLVELDSNCSSARGSVGVSPGSHLSLSRASSQGRRQSGCEREELRMKVEESQRKLQALQEHQAALAALQDKARQQLQEARQEQTALMVRCVGDGEEPLEDAVKLDQLQQRLQNLAEMYHNRNQLAEKLGEGELDEELLPEQLVLQNKLQQLQSKKEHMDHLVAALHNTTTSSTTAGAAATTTANTSTTTTTVSAGPREAARDGGVVRDKIAELNLMKQQLAHLKDLVASVERGKESGDGGSEEQAVNLRRQNVRGPSAGEDLASDIQARTQRLRDAQGRLQQLHDLMGLVGEAHASGQPLPDQCLDMLLREASVSPHRAGQDSTQLDKNAAHDKDLYPMLREKKTNSQSQRQLLALELHAKRLELEALMSKDQGLPSAINHDKPHPLLPGYSGVGEGTTSGTWAGSTRDTIEDLADPDMRDHSLCYSSDEGVEEEEDAEPFPGLQLGAGVLGHSPATNREPLDMSLSVDSAPSPQPRPQMPGTGASRPSWAVSQDAVCGKVAPPAGDYPPTSISHASVLSSAASANNVWKPPHLQGDAQQQSGWGMVYSPLPGDSYYQQLLATSQIQQQNMVLTMLNQCCQLLWLQQRDLQALRSAVHSLQERGAGPVTEAVEGARCNNAGYGLYLPAQEEVQLNNCFPSTPALNNQVPPGNRANNYWDNFRSYSRQNLLSSSASKSNEGVVGTSHSPSPLVERSHNSLQGPALSLGAASLPLQPEQLPQALPAGRKEKLNADQSQRGNALHQRGESSNLGATTAVKKKRHPNPKITSMPPRNTHKPGGPSQGGRQPVYEEVAALISANESRPDFLLQLFRELRALHSDPLRQSALRSIHQLAQQSTTHEESAEGLAAAAATATATVVEDIKVNGFKACAPAADWMFPNLLSDKAPTFGPTTTDEAEEGDGAGAVVPEPLPRNAAWKMKDLLTVSPELQLVSHESPHVARVCHAQTPAVRDSPHLQVAQGQGHGRTDWQVQSVVAELRPLLRAHQDDMCTPALLETLRRAAVRLLPQPQADAYSCSQLDALLRDALLRFHHCRLGSVAEQLLCVVADVLQGELNFLTQAGQLCMPPSPVGDVATAGCVSDEVGEPQSAASLLDVGQAGPATAAPEVYNGDLAEADQSCHTDRDGADNVGDGEAAATHDTGAATTCNESQNHETDVGGEEAVAVQDDGERWGSQEWAPPPAPTPGSESP